MRWPVCIFLVSVLAVMVACGQAPATPNPSTSAAHGTSAASTSKPKVVGHLTKVSLLLDFVPEGDQSPFYYARAKGFFRAAGLSVTIVPGKGSGNTVQAVGHGTYTFGFADASTAAIAISRGVPILVVDDYFQKNPAALVYLASKPIKKPSDLKGKTIAQNPNGATTKLLTAFLHANHLSSSNVKIQNVTPSTLIPSLAAGRVDAVLTTEEVALPQIRAKGINADALLLANWGVSTLSSGIIVNKAYARAHPNVVKAFLAAANHGWRAALADPAAAIAAQTKAVGKNLMPPGAVDMVKLSAPLLHSSRTAGRPLGWMNQQDWKDTLAVLKQYFGLKKTLPPNQYYTNRFLPAQ